MEAYNNKNEYYCNDSEFKDKLNKLNNFNYNKIDRIDELKQLAIQKYGLINNKIRKKAWKLLILKGRKSSCSNDDTKIS